MFYQIRLGRMLFAVLLSISHLARAEADPGNWSCLFTKNGYVIGAANFVVNEEGEFEGHGFDARDLRFTKISGLIEEDKIDITVRMAGFRKTTGGKVHEKRGIEFFSQLKDGSRMLAYRNQPRTTVGLYLGVDSSDRFAWMFINNRHGVGYYLWDGRGFLSVLGRETGNLVRARNEANTIHLEARVRGQIVRGNGDILGQNFRVGLIYWKGPTK